MDEASLPGVLSRAIGRNDAYKPELIVRDLDMDKIKQVRDTWAFYRDRRPDAYEDLFER